MVIINKNSKLFFLCILLSFKLIGQEAIEVADLTLKIGSKDEEVLYYAFAEGDQIIFNFEETDNRELKEIEIVEYPESSKFKDYETKSVKEKKIQVFNTGIYKFRFYNSALLKGRVCKVKISRIPKSKELAFFNTGVKWVEKLDTTYDIKTETVITGYNTYNRQKSRRVLSSIDTSIVSVVDRTERVHSTSSLSGTNVSWINFKLPDNYNYPNIFLPYKSTETISWAYSITVGSSGETWYKNANQRASLKTATGYAVKAGLVSTPYTALALLAVEGLNLFSNPPQGDNINFNFISVINGVNRDLGYGNSVAASGRMTEIKNGGCSLRLSNDNIMDGINVNVNIVAVQVTQTWEDETYTVQESDPIKEKQTRKIPKIAVRKVPVMVKN